MTMHPAGEVSMFGVGDHASAFVERASGLIEMPGVNVDLSALGPRSRFQAGGYFIVECYDKDGNCKWQDVAENGVTNLGLNDVLNVYLRDTSQTATWYLGLIDNAGFTGLAAGDTISSHTGWAESTAYSNANRLAWSAGAASAQAVTNGTTVDFSMNTNSTVIKGLFLVSDNTKGGTSGLLWSTAAFSGGTQSVNSGDTLKVTYTVSAASS
jgi:hypothetical protein